MKSKEVMAWEVWCNSKEGQDCGNPLSLGLETEDDQYLHNRLWCAFMAGLEYGKALNPLNQRIL